MRHGVLLLLLLLGWCNGRVYQFAMSCFLLCWALLCLCQLQVALVELDGVVDIAQTGGSSDNSDGDGGESRERETHTAPQSHSDTHSPTANVHSLCYLV